MNGAAAVQQRSGSLVQGAKSVRLCDAEHKGKPGHLAYRACDATGSLPLKKAAKYHREKRPQFVACAVSSPFRHPPKNRPACYPPPVSDGMAPPAQTGSGPAPGPPRATTPCCRFAQPPHHTCVCFLAGWRALWRTPAGETVRCPTYRAALLADRGVAPSVAPECPRWRYARRAEALRNKHIAKKDCATCVPGWRWRPLRAAAPPQCRPAPRQCHKHRWWCGKGHDPHGSRERQSRCFLTSYFLSRLSALAKSA